MDAFIARLQRSTDNSLAEQKQQTALLKRILKGQETEMANAAARDRRADQRAKTGGSDKSILAAIKAQNAGGGGKDRDKSQGMGGLGALLGAAGIGAVVAYFKSPEFRKQVNDAVMSMVSAIDNKLREMFPVYDDFRDKLDDFVAGVAEMIDKIKAAWKALDKFANDVEYFLKDTWHKFMNEWKYWTTELDKFVKETWKMFTNEIEYAVNQIKRFGDFINTEVIIPIKQGFKELHDGFKDLIDGVTYFGETINLIVDKYVTKPLTEFGESVDNFVKGIFKGFVDNFDTFVGGPWGTFTGAVEDFGDEVKDVVVPIVTKVGELLKPIVDSLKELAEKWLIRIKKGLEFLVDFLNPVNMFKRAAGFVGGNASGIGGGFQNAGEALRNMFNIGLQTGGFVGTVPNTGSDGDNFATTLAPGSVVLNQRASRAFQEGGEVPVMLERGEQVFGPSDPMAPMALAMNSAIPRFQEGGLLAKMNDENIKKVTAPVGRCVQGSLDTMKASGVPEPAATGKDVGNNPRGAAVQLIKDYGWGAAYGSPITLESPYGTAPSKVMGAGEYRNAVSAGKVPSGALVFATRHNDWNGTSNNSRGYDMAIAQQNGGGLWNGVGYNRPTVYAGGTKQVMVLTPGGGGSSGLTPGGGGSTGNGSTGGSSTGMGSVMPTILNEAGPVGAAMAQVFGDIGSVISSMFGGPSLSGGSSGGGGGSGSSAPAAPLTGDVKAKAKMMHDYIVSKGYTSAQAKGIVANIHRESTFNPKARSGDDQGPGGLFQWKGSRQTPAVARLVNSGNWKGQIDYALKEDVGPQYKSATANMNAMDSSMWWAREWERPASLSNARTKHSQFLPSYGFQKGGVAQMRSGGSYGSGMASASQSDFFQNLAEATRPQIIPVPMGGGGGGGGESAGAMVANSSTAFPDLPAQDQSIVAMEYKYRITMGASV